MKASTPQKTPKSAPQGAIGVPAKVKADWQAIERDYRTGQFTLRELESKHGANNATISRRAAKEGWTQDLSVAIRQATNANLIAAIVQEKSSDAQQSAANTVLAAAEVNSQVILKHRNGLNRLTAIKSKLLEQIEQAAENMEDLAEVIEMVRNPDENGLDRANDALRKAMGRSALVDDLKKLADVDEKVRKGEREAFGLNDGPEDDAKAAASMTDAERAVRLVALLKRTKDNA